MIKLKVYEKTIYIGRQEVKDDIARKLIDDGIAEVVDGVMPEKEIKEKKPFKKYKK